MIKKYAKFSSENPSLHKLILAIYFIVLFCLGGISLSENSVKVLAAVPVMGFGLFFFASASKYKSQFPQ